jgi:hypothetical protein
MDAETWFGDGFAFYRGDGKSDRLLPAPGEDYREWIKGFCCAMADEDLDHEDPTIQTALLHMGIDGDLLEELLQAAEAVVNDDKWCRWPSVPIRGYGLPEEAANDEMD